MKNLTLLSLVATALLFTACGEKTKEAVSDAASAVTNEVTSATTSALDTTKKAAADAVEATKEKAAKLAEAAKVEAQKVADATAAKATELKAAAEKKAADAAQALKDRAAAVTDAVTPENAAGKAAYAKCVSCHGANGKTKALGKSNVVAGQTVVALEAALHEYKAGTRNVSGMGMLMKGQVASMDDATIKAVSEYMSSL